MLKGGHPMPDKKEQTLRVAVYIRIGGSGDCELALERQKAQFNELIRSKPEWEAVGFYADVGADSRKQPNLQRLLYDCRAGRIDLVVTKSTSRISRSIPIFMRFVRELAYRKPPVGVYFEDINMNTLEKDNLMLLFLYECISINEDNGTTDMIPQSLLTRNLKSKGKQRRKNKPTKGDDESDESDE
jgi:DNA invertase Pin-like site-specific DNA recombinase